MDQRLFALGLLLFFQGLPQLTLQAHTVAPQNNDNAHNMNNYLRNDVDEPMETESNAPASSVDDGADDASGAASGSAAVFESDNHETTWGSKDGTTTREPLVTTRARELNNSNSGQVDPTDDKALINSSVVNHNPAESSQNQTESSENPTESSQNQTESSENPTESSQNQTESSQNQTESSENPTESSQNQTQSSQDTSLSPRNSSTHTEVDTSTRPLDASNATQSPTTPAPEVNVTKSILSKPENHTSLPNNTSPNNTVVKPTAAHATSRSVPKALSTTTASVVHTTAVVLETSIAQKASNLSDKNAAEGSSSDRGLDSKSKRNGAWGVILGIGVAVAVVGLVVYAILKKRHQAGFSHRKLEEEFPSDPVLRLDNNEPLDFNFGGGAYYNPGLQGDQIQMSHFPQHKRN